MNEVYTLADLPRLREALGRLSITQMQLSKATGVSQGQISRVLAGTGRRPSKAFQAVCNYVFIRSSSTFPQTQAKPLPAALRQAIALVWDGSEEHAEAIGGVIRSLEAFRRPPTEER